MIEESEKKDVVPIADDGDCINLHDLLAQTSNDVKKYEQDGIDDVKYVPEKPVESRRVGSKPGTSKGSFFCAFCRVYVPATVTQLVIPPQPAFRTRARQQLLKKYSIPLVDETMKGIGTILVCKRHVVEEKKVVEEEKEEENVPTVCVFCSNEHILRKYTTVIPSAPREQKIFRRCIRDAIRFRKRISSFMHLAQQQDADAEPLRMCNDHMKAGSISELGILLKPKEKKRRGPKRKVKTPEELQDERLRKLAYTRRRRAEIRQDEALRERVRMYHQARWIKIKNDPVKLAQRNQTHRAYHKKHPRPPETAEQKAQRSERDRLRRERMKREREEREEQTKKGKKREQETRGEQTGKENEEGEQIGEQTEEKIQRTTSEKVEKKCIGAETAEESNADRMSAERRRERSPSKRTRKMTAKARECSEGIW